MKRRRISPPAYAGRHRLEVRGFTRSRWVAPEQAEADLVDRQNPRPLPRGFQGLGSTVSRLAWWTGLDARGGMARFPCGFPDGQAP
jgi:hypothetical protein